MKLIIPIGAKHKGAGQQEYSKHQIRISNLKTLERIEKIKMKNKKTADDEGAQCQM